MNKWIVIYQGARRTDGSFVHCRSVVEAKNKAQAQRIFERCRPGLVVLDVHGFDGEPQGIDWAALILPLLFLGAGFLLRELFLWMT